VSDAPHDGVDFAALYDAHPDYVARRDAASYERQLVDLEVRHFKLPQLVALLRGERLSSVVEIGCATGELIAAFPLAEPRGRRLGLDISPRNIAAARARFGHVEFQAGDFRRFELPRFDAVLLSDVLEHVSDDAAFLADAAALAPRVLVNLPLEDNWLNRGRAYGPADVSGHLRRYDLAQGLDLVARAGLRPVNWSRVWIHETPAEGLRRDLRARHVGQAYAGGAIGRRLRQAVFGLATTVRPLVRALFASNLFVLAQRP
jgi:SAM-dependent methyltransferase